MVWAQVAQDMFSTGKMAFFMPAIIALPAGILRDKIKTNMASNYLVPAVFIATYVLFVFFPKRRTIFALFSAGILLLTGAISAQSAFWAINWNVMGIFVGTLAVADIFMESRVPAHIAELIVDRAKNTGWAILLICLLTGFISAFVENVATVLIVAPIALALAKKLKISPVNMMIAIAVSSNLQGTATLIGDPPSMLLGGFAKLTFWDFFFYQGRPGIFFAVELGALVSFFVLYWFFREQKEKVRLIRVEKIRSLFPSFLLIALVALLAASSFFPVENAAGIICLVFGAIALLWKRLAVQSPFLSQIKALDWDTAFFLAAVFVLVGSLTAAGWINIFANYLSGAVGGSVPLGFIAIVLVSVILSAFIDNVPFLAAMLPVAALMAEKLGINPPLLLFGLLIGASLGGNITPIGASANIVACGLLKDEGHEVSFGQFARIGLPFTIAAVSAASLFIWLVWR
jgi:Na+/H+ antiporter NhaD/arsenite permease-like protein